MSENYHRLLKRQIKKHLGGAIPPEMESLLDVISQSYSHYESDRVLIERTMEISSKELAESNRKLVDDSKRQKLLIESLKESIREVSPESVNLEDANILQIADILRNEIQNRKQAEELIAISEEKYRGIIENMELGMLEINGEGYIVNVYDQFCKMTGYDRDEMLGKHAPTLLIDKEHHPFIEEQQALRAAGNYSVYELPLRRKSGELIWVIISAAPVFDTNGNVIGTVAVHFDITHRKKTEAALEAARQQAENALKGRELFLANISHEIRTPMNAILGMSRLMNESNLNATQRQYTHTIHSSAEGLMVIINDILDISKMTSGKFTVEEISFDLDQVLKSITKALSYRAEEKGIYLNVKRDLAINQFLIGDPTRLNQVITNLVSNAIKFTKEGGVDIVLTHQKTDNNKDTIKFEVIDSGIGIAEDKLATIFDSFSQEDTSITRKYGGTGLGLAISLQLVEIFGGKLQVQSEQGKGSNFYFTITLEHGEVLETEDIKVVGEKDLSGCNILLVEDNEINRFLAITILKKWHAEVEIAEHGKHALEILDNQTFDVILMDMQMPEMDGLQTTEYIRANIDKNTPIIALTANAVKGERDKCFEAGMNDYVSKPFDPDDLFNKITKHWEMDVQEFHTMGASQRFSLDKLQKMYKGNRTFVQKTVDIFLEQFTRDLETMISSLEEQNYYSVQRLAHKIKPNIELFEIEELRTPILEIETLANESEGEKLKPLVNFLITKSREISEELRRVISEE